MPYTNPTNDGTAFIVANSVNIESSLNRPTVCEFETVDETGDFRFTQGEQVVILDDATSIRIFAGIVYETVESVMPGSDSLHSRVRAVDFTQLLDRHVVAKAYNNTDLNAILSDIVSTHLTQDGVTIAETLPDPPVFQRVVFNYSTVTECLNDLANITGYHWYVDYDRALYFGPRVSTPAGFSVTDATQTWHGLSVRRSLEEYRNTQLIAGGLAGTNPRTETLERIGRDRGGFVSLPIASQPTVVHYEVPGRFQPPSNSYTATVGILGVDAGKDFYWSRNSQAITADPSVEIGEFDALDVTYSGLIPLLVRSVNEDEVSSRAGVQADSGVFEHFLRDAGLDSVSAAIDRGAGFLRKFGRIQHRVMFEMDSVIHPDVTSLRTGQLIPITLARHDIDGDYLVEGISIRDIGLEFYRYSITCASGESLGGWSEFFRKIADQRGGFSFQEDETIMMLKQFRETVTLLDDVTVTTAPV